MKRALLTTLVLTCLLPAATWGQQVSRSHRQAASDVVEQLRAAQSDPQALVNEMIDAQVRLNPQLEPVRDVLIEWGRKYYNWDVIGPRLIDVYARTFTESELRDLAAFYRTPAGRKLLQKEQELELAGVRIGQEVGQQHQGELEALIKARLKQTAPAEKAPTVGNEHANDLAHGWLARANDYYDKKMWQEAKNAYLRYLEEHPDDADATVDLGICYKELGDFERAIRNFDRALVFDAGHWQALYNKIIVLGFHVDKKAEAKKLMRELRRLQPNNPDVARLAQEVAKL